MRAVLPLGGGSRVGTAHQLSVYASSLSCLLLSLHPSNAPPLLQLQQNVARLQYLESSTVGRSIVSKQEARVCDLENKLEFQRGQVKRFEVRTTGTAGQTRTTSILPYRYQNATKSHNTRSFCAKSW